MRRQSDIGWTELIIGIILIIFGLFIVRQPVGIITWIVIVCGVLAILTGIADIILYVRMERFTGFGPILSLITGILSVMAGFMLIVHPGAGTWAIGNDPSDLDHCTLCFQTFPSSVYENAFWNNLLSYFDDFEYSRIDRRIPAGIPADDHDLFHGSTCGCLSDS